MRLLAALPLLASLALALPNPQPLSLTTKAGILSSSATLASTLSTYLSPSTGLLPPPITAGPTLDFLGPWADGNDDQGWWALAALSAHEYALPHTTVSWLSSAQNVHTQMVARWDTTSCGGGLKWKISPTAQGYNYKSTISNALFFQLSARLFLATGDAKYGDWAHKIFMWCRHVGLIDRDSWAVYDGTDDSLYCKQVDHDQWSYNVGVFLYGSAVMQTLSDDPLWDTRTQGLLTAATRKFITKDGIMREVKCEGYLVGTMEVLPSTEGVIRPLLESSAAGAVASCGKGPNGNTCGIRWDVGKWDGSSGVGQQMGGLEVVLGLMVRDGAEKKEKVKGKLGKVMVEHEEVELKPAKVAKREVSVDRRRKL